jgi:cytochrome c-type biogenesis protein CcmF
MGKWTPMIALGLLLAFWVIASLFIGLRQRLVGQGGFMQRVRAQPLSYYGMQLAHLGVAVFIIGVTMVKGYETERDVRMEIGDTVLAGGYIFRLESVSEVEGANYLAARARITISEDGKAVTELFPEKRLYNASGMPMTEAAIDTGLFRDLYVSMGEQIPGEAEAWAIRVYHKPFVDWIWAGCLFMALGGVLAIGDRRYRLNKSKKNKTAGDVPAKGMGAAKGKTA